MSRTTLLSKATILLLLFSIIILGYHKTYAEPNGGTFNIPHIDDDFTNFIVYDREKAIQYAKKWSDPDNQGNFHPDFERMDEYGSDRGGDCANFVSQLLHAGGLRMNDEWYYEKGSFIRKIPILNRAIKYFSPKWAVADEQYRYFSDLNNGFAEETIEISTMEDLTNAEESGGIKPGDLLYWDFNGDGKVDHATMITGVDHDGQLLYSGHTSDQFNAEVKEVTQALYNEKYNTKLYIVKMKDRIEVK